MKRIIVVLFSMVILVGVANAAVTQTKAVIASGGVHSSAGNLTMSSIIGEPIVGHSVSGSTDIWHGFYAPAPTQLVGVDNEPRITFISFLGRATPNPARASAVIEFGNAVHQRVELSLYDVAGRYVRKLHSGDLHAGVFRIPWDLRSDAGQTVSAGMYFIRLSTRDFRGASRMVVVR